MSKQAHLPAAVGAQRAGRTKPDCGGAAEPTVSRRQDGTQKAENWYPFRLRSSVAIAATPRRTGANPRHRYSHSQLRLCGGLHRHGWRVVHQPTNQR